MPHPLILLAIPAAAGGLLWLGYRKFIAPSSPPPAAFPNPVTMGAGSLRQRPRPVRVQITPANAAALERAMVHLEVTGDGLATEGLYRVCGEYHAQQELAGKIVSGELTEGDLRAHASAPFTVAGAIKECLRERLEPIIGGDLYAFFVENADKNDAGLLRNCVALLPAVPRALLRRILGHLYLVRTCRGNDKRMTSAGLATVFGLNLLSQDPGGGSDLLAAEAGEGPASAVAVAALAIRDVKVRCAVATVLIDGFPRDRLFDAEERRVGEELELFVRAAEEGASRGTRGGEKAAEDEDEDNEDEEGRGKLAGTGAGGGEDGGGEWIRFAVRGFNAETREHMLERVGTGKTGKQEEVGLRGSGNHEAHSLEAATTRPGALHALTNLFGPGDTVGGGGEVRGGGGRSGGKRSGGRRTFGGGGGGGVRGGGGGGGGGGSSGWE